MVFGMILSRSKLAVILTAGLLAVGTSGCSQEGGSFARMSATDGTLARTDGDSAVDDGEGEGDGDSQNENEVRPEDRCDRPGIENEKHLKICHVPAGNPAARHTICPAVQGAINGHGIDPSDAQKIGAHGGDTLGACSDDSEQD
jgi:hypothetical protein